MTPRIFVSLLIVSLFAAPSCGEDSPPSGSDADTDTDTDTDSDTDSDADGDADGDADSDTDGDTDADSDADGDADTDSDADGDCTAEVLQAAYVFAGMCQSASLECPGGSKPSDDCTVEGEACCLFTDQCETVTEGAATCSETECATAPKPQVGCPDSQWCCLTP